MESIQMEPVDHLFDLTGKKALVTGASRGLGKAMAVALGSAGCDVALNARSADALRQTQQEVERLGRKTVLVPGDVSDEAQVRQLVEAAHKALTRIDILVNNAGVWGGSYFLRTRKEDWDKVVGVNLTGVYLMAKEVGKVMLKQKSGKIINMTSVQAFRGRPQALAYSTTKAGVIQMTRVMAVELGPSGIQVNCLAPGLFATDMTKVYTDAVDSPALKEYISKIPSQRYGQPEELAGAVIFLASKATDHMTGQILVIDGGESIV